MRYLSYALLLLQLSVSAIADTGSELEKLHGALNMLNQQQQAIYQQFQMVQEIRRSSAEPAPFTAIPMLPQLYGQFPNYDETVAAQKNARLRVEDLNQQAEQLMAEYIEIEDKKKPLQQRIYELSLKGGDE